MSRLLDGEDLVFCLRGGVEEWTYRSLVCVATIVLYYREFFHNSDSVSDSIEVALEGPAPPPFPCLVGFFTGGAGSSFLRALLFVGRACGMPPFCLFFACAFGLVPMVSLETMLHF